MYRSWKLGVLPRAAAFVAAAALSITVVATANANETGNEVVGGFEIDGNYYEGFDNDSTADDPIDPQGIDWGTPEVEAEYDHIVDGTGGPDETVYDRGSKEDDLESWNDDSSAAAPGDADINNVYVYDLVDPATDDQYAFIAWDRVTDTGSVQWFLELNHLPNTTNDNGTSVPDRSDGDLRISMINHGNGDFTVEDIESWDAATESWVPIDTDSVVGTRNDSTISVPDGTRTEQLFNEFGFNLTELTGDGDDCAFTGFTALNLRSEAGLGNQSELKDYATGPIDIPSRCGDIRVEKQDADGNLIGGATFEISPDPTPGSDAASLVVTDNDASDAHPADGVIVISPAEPGDYTVTETEPPPGYIQDEPPQDVTLEEYGSVTVVFTNGLGSISWSKTDAEDGELICCATFEISPNPLIGEPVDPPLTVTDNDGEYDTDPADGSITIEDVKTGTYTVTETVPPDGYDLPDSPASDPVIVDADNPDVTISDGFVDPRKVSELTVQKVAEDTEAALAGATFELYLDDGDGVGDAPDDGDELAGTCTTEDDGTCTIGELGFGDYYWYETEAPSGYVIPSDATSDIITISADNAGTEMSPATFTDPPEDAPPPPDDEPTPPDDEPSPQPTPELPDTGTSGAEIIGVAGLLLVGGGATAWAVARRRVGAPG